MTQLHISPNSPTPRVSRLPKLIFLAKRYIIIILITYLIKIIINNEANTPSMPSNIVSILISLISQTINFIITSLISLYPILQIPYDVETSRDMPKSYLNSLELDPTRTCFEEPKLYTMITSTLHI